MTYLILALLALGLGPLLDRIAARKGFVAAAMDGFTFVAMSGIILGHVLPESIRHAGWWALVLAVVGVFGPTIFGPWVQGRAGAARRSPPLRAGPVRGPAGRRAAAGRADVLDHRPSARQ